MRRFWTLALVALAVAAVSGGTMAVTYSASATDSSLTIQAGEPLAFKGGTKAISSVNVGLTGTAALDELVLKFTLPSGLAVSTVNKTAVCGAVERGVQRCRPSPPAPGATERYGFTVNAIIAGPTGTVQVQATGRIGQQRLLSGSVPIAVQP